MPGQEQLDAQAAEGGQSPPVENPTSRRAVHEWIMGRVAADEQMRWAGTARKARERAQEEQT